MKELNSKQIREMWIKFWEAKQHMVLPSASLVPDNDPTLLWINSGVATLKHYLDGSEVPENPRIANVQKCIRTNDIENVGVTARHQTFFEMLGNWSIGDYFKQEAISWAWELLTEEAWFGLNGERLYMTYHPDDEETLNIWRQVSGLDETHFIPLEDNFWDLGAGPCGPCTEIFFDRGKKYQDLADDDPEMFPGGENERYLEIWNIVISQYNHLPDNTYQPLKQKNIDTGMGLERMVSVVQDTKTNFETDLFVPIIEAIEPLTTGYQYGEDSKLDTSFKVIADHIRAVSFAIGDHALPSNEGRGYILRRLIRRSVMHARHLGITKPFLADLVPIVGRVMGSYYTNLLTEEKFIRDVIAKEENKFQETIADGEQILRNLAKEKKANGGDVLPGESAFMLYDTFGFPLELTEEYLAELGMTVDITGFNIAMEAQRKRARQARGQQGGLDVQATALQEITEASEFVGYSEDQTETQVISLLSGDNFVEELAAGTSGFLVTKSTPFYAERGGQVADTGKILSAEGEVLARVIDVKHAPNEQNVHNIEVLNSIHVGQTVVMAIDSHRRDLIRRNHTATHLLHEALKEVLGQHVNQAGSLLDDKYLRFDFNHFGPVTDEEIAQIEALVNQKISENIPVKTTITDLETAKKLGAQAHFGDKYDKFGGGKVRMVEVADFSKELCGGTHVKTTGEIGVFKVTAEMGIGSGIRRVEALTSDAALAYFLSKETLLNAVKRELKVTEDSRILAKIAQNESERKSLSQEIESLHAKANQAAAQAMLSDVKEVSGITYIAQSIKDRTMDDLRSIYDDWKQSSASQVLLLATSNNGKVNLLVACDQSAQARGLKAGMLVKELAPIVKGGGGGRPDMAQAGGKDANAIPQVLNALDEIIANQGQN